MKIKRRRNPLSNAIKIKGWKQSRVPEHIFEKHDRLATVRPLLVMVKKDWEGFLNTAVTGYEIKTMQKHERTGRPMEKDNHGLYIIIAKSHRVILAERFGNPQNA